jgi:hypothetical protein
MYLFHGQKIALRGAGKKLAKKSTKKVFKNF